jgi:hypothetical protein
VLEQDVVNTLQCGSSTTAPQRASSMWMAARGHFIEHVEDVSMVVAGAAMMEPWSRSSESVS